MKKIIVALYGVSLFLFVFSQNVFAVPTLGIADPNNGEKHLYEIWEDTFNVDIDDSSQALFDSYGITNDSLWYETNGGVHLEATYAGFRHQLGFSTDGSTIHSIGDWLDADGSFSYNPEHEFNLTVQAFEWVDQYSTDGDNHPEGKIFSKSDNANFAAFEVPDELLSNFTGGINLEGYNQGEVWFLAFEDQPVGSGGAGDEDYNDLVFVATDVAPVPEPTTMLLFGTGLLGLVGFGRKKFFKKS